MTVNSTDISRNLGLQTIHGTVEPCTFHSQRVSLVEHDTNKEYCVLPKGAGVDLIDLVSENIELVGVVSELLEDDEARLFIQVRGYQTEERF